MSTTFGSSKLRQTLCERFGAPDDLTVKHKLPYIDEGAARFLAQCPFVIVATADAQGRCGRLHRKETPRALFTLPTNTLCTCLIVPGNKMFQGILTISWRIPMSVCSCIIPGEEWTMRINGHARIVDDPKLLQSFSGP
jgi:predicted pyridoxine 5'-phosphate oxidase superfamily flavin-nucleotide-binding protein